MTAQSPAITVPFPLLQRQAIDWLELNHRRHTTYGLIEVDVTETRLAIREYRARTGAPLSLTAFIMYCFARAVDEDKTMQACRLGRRRLVLFDEVDVASMVEREVNGFKIPVPHIVRAASTRSLEEIQREITAAQQSDAETVAVSSVPSRLRPLMLRGLPVWLLLPAAIRRL